MGKNPVHIGSLEQIPFNSLDRSGVVAGPGLVVCVAAEKRIDERRGGYTGGLTGRKNLFSAETGIGHVYGQSL